MLVVDLLEQEPMRAGGGSTVAGPTVLSDPPEARYHHEREQKNDEERAGVLRMDASMVGSRGHFDDLRASLSTSWSS